MKDPPAYITKTLGSRPPGGELDRQWVAAIIALGVLGAVDGTDLDAAAAEAVGLLALVAGQDVEPGEISRVRGGSRSTLRRTG